MNHGSESLWLDTTPGTDFPRLEEDVSTETVIVGGGITGLTTAHILGSRDVDTVLLEKDRIVEKVTGHTTAKITSLQGTRYSNILSSFDRRKAERYAQANQEAVEKIADTVEKEGIECGFRRSPTYTYAATNQEKQMVKEELEAAKKAGLPVSRTDTPLPFETSVAVKLDGQAYFHPRKYLLELAEAIEDRGGRIFEQTRVKGFETGSPHKIETDLAMVNADSVVIATHFPFYDAGFYFARMYPRYSYAVAVKTQEMLEGMFISPGENFRSVRPAPGNYLIIGGEGHPTGHGGDTEHRYQRLEGWARENFEVESVDYRWSTQDYTTVDYVPYVGGMPFTEDVYLATGFGGWGMTNGTVAAEIISDLVTGNENPWTEVYSPSRVKPVRTGRRLLHRNWHAVKMFVQDRLKQRQSRLSELRRGEAEVMEIDGEKVAAYRDEQGELHTVSAVCTHLRCIVSWNNAEKTWDCPCHGSRFDYHGKVIDGPANRELETKDLEGQR